MPPLPASSSGHASPCQSQGTQSPGKGSLPAAGMHLSTCHKHTWPIKPNACLNRNQDAGMTGVHGDSLMHVAAAEFTKQHHHLQCGSRLFMTSRDQRTMPSHTCPACLLQQSQPESESLTSPRQGATLSGERCHALSVAERCFGVPVLV
jgi:hypothetical protein